MTPFLLFRLALGTHQRVQTHKVMSTSAKPLGIQGHPVKLYLASCSPLALTAVMNGEENHQSLKVGTDSEEDL